ERLVEAAVELDDDATTAYLEGKQPDEATLKRLVRQATIASKFFPVFCGSAFKNKGVQPLLDGVVHYLPSPLEVPPVEGKDPQKEDKIIKCKTDFEEPTVALAFKIAADPFAGSLTFIRVY